MAGPRISRAGVFGNSQRRPGNRPGVMPHHSWSPNIVVCGSVCKTRRSATWDDLAIAGDCQSMPTSAVIEVRFTLPTAATTNRHASIGGVISAIATLSDITMPKCRGSNPASVAVGASESEKAGVTAERPNWCSRILTFTTSFVSKGDLPFRKNNSPGIILLILRSRLDVVRSRQARTDWPKNRMGAPPCGPNVHR